MPSDMGLDSAFKCCLMTSANAFLLFSIRSGCCRRCKALSLHTCTMCKHALHTESQNDQETNGTCAAAQPLSVEVCTCTSVTFSASFADRCQIWVSEPLFRPFLQTQHGSRCSLPCLPNCNTWGNHPKVQCADWLSALSASVPAQQIAVKSHLGLWSVAPGSTHHTQQPSWSSASAEDTKLACGFVSVEEASATAERNAACSCVDCVYYADHVKCEDKSSCTWWYAQTGEHTTLSS